MSEERFTYLFLQYMSKTCSPEERQEFLLLAQRPGYHALLEELSERHPVTESRSPLLDDAVAGEILQAVLRLGERSGKQAAEVPPMREPVQVLLYRRWWIAASVLLVLAAGAYWWVAGKKEASSTGTLVKTDILPGKRGAILTLADGSQVSLDTIANGIIALQGGATARVTDGRLVYEVGGAEAVYNTMSTPKGRQYHVTLPDGSQAWLNAASSIRYPTVFTGKERRVAITGEVYLEVTKNRDMPFLVNAGDRAVVEVLGTHFNVNAYENEAGVHTTLLEGSVRVMGGPAGRQLPGQSGASSQAVPPGEAAAILKPGQQALITNAGGITVTDNADVEKAMAWKNGLFNFEETTLEEIMRQLERWYDIEVIYEKEAPDIALSGKITRGVSLNGLLGALKRMGLQYRLEGRKLTVLPGHS